MLCERASHDGIGAIKCRSLPTHTCVGTESIRCITYISWLASRVLSSAVRAVEGSDKETKHHQTVALLGNSKFFPSGIVDTEMCSNSELGGNTELNMGNVYLYST